MSVVVALCAFTGRADDPLFPYFPFNPVFPINPPVPGDDRDNTEYANLVKIELGNFGNVKSIEGKDAEDLFEQRMFFGPGFRTYFGKDNGTFVVLLCGGGKKTQKKDIARAKQLWKEYKTRKGG